MEDNERFSEEWQTKEVVINRREYADIVTREIACVLGAAKMAGVKESTYDLIRELFLSFVASVGAEIFQEEDEVEIDKEEE